MDIQLQELLDKIKRDGVDAAEVQAASLLAQAAVRRDAIVAGAEREAKLLLDRARAEAAKAEEAGKAALAQAARDLVLAFRDRIGAVLAAVVKVDSSAAFGPEVLADAIPAVLKALASSGAEGGDELAVLLPPETLKRLEGRFAGLLAAELKKGVELRPFPDLQAGFRVAEKDGSAYYDFSADAVAELLARHLNARLAETVRGAAKGM